MILFYGSSYVVGAEHGILCRPGGIQQQFKVARPMLEQLLSTVSKTLEKEGEFKGKVLDDSDAVAAWTNGSIEAVLFPTGDTLNDVEKRAENKELVLMVNPQWRTGQVVSDFGFFGRRRKEEFVATFETVFSVTSKRAGGRTIWYTSYILNVTSAKLYSKVTVVHWDVLLHCETHGTERQLCCAG